MICAASLFLTTDAGSSADFCIIATFSLHLPLRIILLPSITAVASISTYSTLDSDVTRFTASCVLSPCGDGFPDSRSKTCVTPFLASHLTAQLTIARFSRTQAFALGMCS